MDKIPFAERLSLCMQKLSLTGVQLAAMSGVKEATISRYLNSLRSPTAENIVLLSKALGVTSDYLLGLSDCDSDFSLLSLYHKSSDDDRFVVSAVLKKYGGEP